MRPESHVTGDIGQKAVSLMFSEWGWTADQIQSDYGEDLNCHVFVEHQRTPLHFRCQVKSSSDAKNKLRRLKSGDFSIRIASDTCRDWLFAYFPVLLIVYDRQSGTAFWANATSQIRSKISLLSRSEVTLHVSHKHILKDEQQQVMSVITSFYTQLLKVQSESVERSVFPVLMPRYRVLPSMEAVTLLRVDGHNEIGTEPTFVHRNSLPAWTTSLRTLDGESFAGMSFRVSSANLAHFSGLLVEQISTKESPSSECEWLAFVCSPIRFSVQSEEDAEDMLGRDLTGWSSYAKINGEVVSDHAYAFDLPQGFLRQIGRRGRSWRGHYFVSLENDLSVQLLAKVATTPADQLFQSTLNEHMLGQFLAWECPRDELELLQKLLWNEELVFRQVEVDEADAHISEFISGAISTPMFAPDIGLIPRARTWSEFEHGTVKSRIEGAELLSCIPGREGSPQLKERLLKVVGHLINDVPDDWFVDGTQSEPGLPIDLSMRRVVVQRFQACRTFNPEQATHILREGIAALMADNSSIEAEAYIVESFEEIAVLSVSWSPRLSESSAFSVQQALPNIALLFDQILPSKPSANASLGTTLGTLRLAGELYFEDDQMF